MMGISIRSFHPTDAEHEAIARLNALAPEEDRLDFEPCSAEELRAFDAGFEAAGYALRRCVAEEAGTGRIVGYAHWFHMPWMSSRERCWCAIRCDPAFRRRGIGARLYAEAMRGVQALGASAVRMEARESRRDALARLERLGFRELFRSSEFELDLQRASVAAASDRAPRSAGITVAPLPEEQARDPAWLPKVYALHAAVTRDVPLPGYPHPEPPIDWFSNFLQGRPASLPDACFLAREGERYVGLAVMHRSMEQPDRLNHLLTGVDREHRGRGIAMALKLRTIAYGVERGYARIWTAVESNNPAMLGINRKLGFVHVGGIAVLERQLSG